MQNTLSVNRNAGAIVDLIFQFINSYHAWIVKHYLMIV